MPTYDDPAVLYDDAMIDFGGAAIDYEAPVAYDAAGEEYEGVQ